MGLSLATHRHINILIQIIAITHCFYMRAHSEQHLTCCSLLPHSGSCIIVLLKHSCINKKAWRLKYLYCHHSVCSREHRINQNNIALFVEDRFQVLGPFLNSINGVHLLRIIHFSKGIYLLRIIPLTIESISDGPSVLFVVQNTTRNKQGYVLEYKGIKRP